MATPLKHAWTFSFFRKSPTMRAEPYDKQTKDIATVDTIEEFWGVYLHLAPATALQDSVDIHIFKDGIRPVWEDQANRDGGKWILRLKKGLAHRYWEALLLALVGEQFEDSDELCGCVLSCRFSEDIISVWNKQSHNRNSCIKIRDTLRRVLEIPLGATFEYKPHVEAIKDLKSYRGAHSEFTVLN
jgi:translation initiation factor 4E